MSLSAYKRTIVETESARQIERRILSQITSRLIDDQEAFDAAPKSEKIGILEASLRETISDNLKVWSMLKVDLISPSNKLPAEMRGSLISMALFVEKQSAKVLGGASGVNVLVSINKSLIDGLGGKAPEEQ